MVNFSKKTTIVVIASVCLIGVVVAVVLWAKRQPSGQQQKKTENVECAQDSDCSRFSCQAGARPVCTAARTCRCAAEGRTTKGCYDSDPEDDPLLQGYVQDQAGKRYEDQCVCDEIFPTLCGQVKEFRCDAEGNVAESSEHQDGFQCKDGVLRQITCKDSDGGDDSYAPGSLQISWLDGSGMTETYLDQCEEGTDIIHEFACGRYFLKSRLTCYNGCQKNEKGEGYCLREE